MIHQLKSYLKFRLKAKRKHGVHSPFVFDFGNACFYGALDQSARIFIKKYKNELLSDKSTIAVEDFGAGAKSMAANERKVSDIAKNAGISLHRGRVLNRIVTYMNATKILEIGTSVGIGTASLAYNHNSANIITLEGCTQTAGIAQRQFDKHNFNHIEIVLGDFKQSLPDILSSNSFDLIFFDGNHQKEATLSYFEQCLAHRNEESVFIFDDIYWSKGMTEAWEIIKKHPEVTVSIDTFYWGIVFFRKGQVKEDFVLRMK